MLAATWGEITGSPGVCLSTRGPGAANMVNGVAHALLDRAPLIAITDAYSRPTYETGLAPAPRPEGALRAARQMEHDHRCAQPCASRCAGPCVRPPAHRRVRCTSNCRKARPRARRAPRWPSRRCAQISSVPAPSAATSSGVLGLIGRAKRPILLAGLGVFWARAAGAFVRFAERLGAPVLTTSKCKGAIPEDHPLRAGCIIGGLIERNLVNQADLIITVGPRRRRAAAQALALHAARAGALGRCQPRCAGAGRSGGRGRARRAVVGAGRMGAGARQLG